MLTSDTPFAGYGLGATPNMSALPGICHPKAPKPLASVRRLQTALRGLAQRTSNPNVSTPVDGLVGPHTVRAVNYAVPKYASADPLLASGRLTHPQIVSFAPQLAAVVEQAPIQAPATPQVQAPPPAPTQSSPSFWQSVAQGTAMYAAQQGGQPMPAPGYYPPPGPYRGYPPPGGGYYPPGGGREASVDIKAFIPAQFEHVHFNPAFVALGIGAVVITVLVMQKKQKAG